MTSKLESWRRAAYNAEECLVGCLASPEIAKHLDQTTARMPEPPCAPRATEIAAMTEPVTIGGRSAANATHELICQHVCRWTKTYVMRCHVLKTMPDGRLKLLVFGDRNWKDRDHIVRTRYVEAGRVRVRAQANGEVQ